MKGRNLDLFKIKINLIDVQHMKGSNLHLFKFFFFKSSYRCTTHEGEKFRFVTKIFKLNLIDAQHMKGRNLDRFVYQLCRKQQRSVKR